jgi:protein-disulfide isomerase
VPLLEQVLDRYPGQVKLVFKNFPLQNHRHALKAAMAATAAGKQGKFWEFHDRLFANTDRLNDRIIGEIAVNLQLNLADFERSMMAPETLRRIQQDTSDGRKAGVRGTPTVFINGRLLRDRTLGGFQSVINAELNKTGPPQ